VAQSCHPRYSGGRDHEDHDSKPSQGTSSARLYLKNTLHKNRAHGVAQGESPEFKPQFHKKKKNFKHSMYYSRNFVGRLIEDRNPETMTYGPHIVYHLIL
jgi:hypothetical protein